MNKKEKREYMKKWRRKNRLHIRKYKRKYYRKNKAKIGKHNRKKRKEKLSYIRKRDRKYKKSHRKLYRKSNKKYYQKNKKILKRKQRKYYSDNKKIISVKQKKYKKNHPEVQLKSDIKSLKILIKNGKFDGIKTVKDIKYALNHWSKSVKKRDNYVCQDCGGKSYLNSHHIKEKAKFPKLALDIDNGITLCKNCHFNHHYGK